MGLLISIDFYFGLLLVGCAVGVLLLRRNRAELLITMLILGLGLGIGRAALVPRQQHDLNQHLNQTLTVTALVADVPDVRENNTRLVLSVVESEVKIITSVSRYPEYEYGEVVQATGTLVLPKNFLTDTGREFDYQSYLALRGIFYELQYPRLERVGTGAGNPIKAVLFKARSVMIKKIEELLPEPESSLLGGILLGARQSLGDDLLGQFRRVGISHIIVLSGYNVTIVAESLIRLLAVASMRLAFSVGALGVVLFAIMTGGSASVVRASIMALLVLLARAVGRLYSINRALALAAGLMIFYNPLILLHDIGFQLSVLSTFALINLSPRVESRLSWLPNRLGLRSVVAATVATQFFVLPWLIYQIGQVSLVALPVNLLIVPLVPLTMLVGFVALVAGFVHGLAAWPAALVVRLLLKYQLLVTDIGARLPLAALDVPVVPLPAIIAVYALGCWWYLRRRVLL